MAALEAATRVAGNALALVEDLHRGRGETHSDLGAGVAVGHRVVVAIKLDVVVDAHPGKLPLRQLIARQRQGLERGAILLLEDAATRPGELLEVESSYPYDVHGLYGGSRDVCQSVP